MSTTVDCLNFVYYTCIVYFECVAFVAIQTPVAQDNFCYIFCFRNSFHEVCTYASTMKGTIDEES